MGECEKKNLGGEEKFGCGAENGVQVVAKLRLSRTICKFKRAVDQVYFHHP
jgi:hypothetical protein